MSNTDGLAQHADFTADYRSYRESLADCERELEIAALFLAESDGAKALYYLLRANGALGMATGIAATVGSAWASGAHERIALGNRVLALSERLSVSEVR